MGYIKSISSNKKHSLFNWMDYIVILILMSFFTGVSLINFGDRFKQGHWFGDMESKTLTVTLAKPQLVQQISLYFGLSNGVIDIQADGDNGQKYSLGRIDSSSVKVPLVFRWINVSFSPLKLSRIRVIVSKPVVELKQIAIYDKNNTYVRNLQLNSFPNDKRDFFTNFISVKRPVVDENQNWLTSASWDEVYYSTTAFQLINMLPPYNTAHPPLGMLLIGVGILLFGMCPFGWRFIPLLSGILLIPLIYYFARILFNRRCAIFASLLFCLDFMHYGISKIATIESLVTFFLLLEYIFLYKYLLDVKNRKQVKLINGNLFLTSLFLGFAIATKWSGCFSIVPLLLIISYCEICLSQNVLIKKAGKLCASLAMVLSIIIIIYLASYLPQYFVSPSLNFLKFVYNIQKDILVYHLHEAFQAHLYASKWWSWTFNYRPYTIYSYSIGNNASVITLMGNPAIWFFAIIACLIIVMMICKQIDKSKISLIFILLIFLSQYLPYAFISRTSFIYYFYSATPFLCIIIARVLDEILLSGGRLAKYTVRIYLFVVILLFLLFFPILSATQIPVEYVKNYLMWYPNWNFIN
ncbi:phospholipid carrier-dependent glycosyltransferase [Aquella oligotrophica]|nr:phospholipid carrier-dependent glycosyltransferase [Aquella oligotrophica]